MNQNKQTSTNAYFVEQIEYTVNRLHDLAGVTHADMMRVAQKVAKNTSSNLPFVIGVIMRNPHDFNQLYTMPVQVIQNLYENLIYFSKDPTDDHEEEKKEPMEETVTRDTGSSFPAYDPMEHETLEEFEVKYKRFRKHVKKMVKAIEKGDIAEVQYHYNKSKKLFKKVKKLQKILDRYDGIYD